MNQNRIQTVIYVIHCEVPFPQVERIVGRLQEELIEVEEKYKKKLQTLETEKVTKVTPQFLVLVN